MKLLIIRHGDPDYEHDTLTERGRAEADLLRDRLLTTEHITHVYVSPLGRAQATAAPFLAASGMHAETLDWLREFPRPVNQPFAELSIQGEHQRTCPWDVDPRVFAADADRLRDPNAWMEHSMYRSEGAAEHAAAVIASFEALLAQHGITSDGVFYRPTPGTDWKETDGQTIALFCHMGLGSLLLSRLANMAPSHFWQMFRFMPTSVSTTLFYKYRDTDIVRSTIFAVGDTAHLAPIGLTWRG